MSLDSGGTVLEEWKIFGDDFLALVREPGAQAGGCCAIGRVRRCVSTSLAVERRGRDRAQQMSSFGSDGAESADEQCLGKRSQVVEARDGWQW